MRSSSGSAEGDGNDGGGDGDGNEAVVGIPNGTLKVAHVACKVHAPQKQWGGLAR